MNPISIFFVEYVTIFAIFALVARMYVWPKLTAVPLLQALLPLLLFHVARVMGLSSLIPGIVDVDMPPGFTGPQAYGDFMAAILAGFACIAILLKSRLVIPLTWLFSIVGIADFILASINALRYDIFVYLNGYWFVPMVIVPALIVIHIMIIMLLMRKPALK